MRKKEIEMEYDFFEEIFISCNIERGCVVRGGWWWVVGL